MTAATIVADFSIRRISVRMNGDRVKLTAPSGVVCSADLDVVRKHKAEIVELVSGWMDEPSSGSCHPDYLIALADDAEAFVPGAPVSVSTPETSNWRAIVANWPSGKWKAWHDRVTAATPWGSTVEQIQRAEWESFQSVLIHGD